MNFMCWSGTQSRSIPPDQKSLSNATLLPPMTVRETEVEMTELINPSHTDCNGCIRLGYLLKLIDAAAVMSAEKLASAACVTCAMDELIFGSSSSEAEAGCILVIIASVNAVYNTSMEVGVRVEVEKNSLRLLICKAYLVFVPQQRPPGYQLRSLVPETDDETLKMALAQERKKIRVAVKGLVDRAVAKAEISTSINTAPLERQLNLTLSTGLVVKDSGPTNDLVGKSPRMQSVQLVLPSHANHMNNTFGGQVMEWMVEGSIIAAMRHVKQRVRVQSIDHVYFVAPSTVGDRIHVKAQVNRSFGGSIEVGVRAEAINPSSGSTPVLICKMFACMTTIIVAPDGKVRMNDIPDVSPISIDEIRRWRAAKGRQQIRLERRALAESNSSSTKIAWAWSKYLTTQEFRYNNISSLLHLASTPKGYWQPIAYEDDHDKDNNKGIINIELKETTDDVTAVKLCTTIEASAISTFQFLKDVQNRKMWDQFFTDAEIRESIDEEDDILWLAMGDKDFCLLRS